MQGPVQWEKAPIPLTHDLPVEPPHGPAPKSPLRVLALAVLLIVAFLGLLWLIEIFDTDDPGTEPGVVHTVSTKVSPADCPRDAPAHARCFVGVVTNQGSEAQSPECSWTSGDVPFRYSGGEFRSPRLNIDGRMISDVLVVRGGQDFPSITCVD